MSWGVMEVGNIAPRAGIKPLSLVFCASVLKISPTRLPDVTILTKPNCLYGFLSKKSVQTSTLIPLELIVSLLSDLNAYNYIEMDQALTYTTT